MIEIFELIAEFIVQIATQFNKKWFIITSILFIIGAIIYFKYFM